MSGLGSPVISVVEISEGYYMALEGSHRTTAAKELGLVPVLQIIDTLEGNPDRERILTEVSVRESRKLGIEFDNIG